MVGRNSDAEVELQKTNISNNIRAGIFTVIHNDRGKSDVWKNYRLILDETGAKIKGFVWCSLCESVRTYNDKGTQPLWRHKQEHEEAETRRIQQRRMDEYVDKLKKKFTSKIREDVRDVSTEFVIRDSRPFEAVKGIGLVRLLMLFSQIGEKFGKLSEEEVKYLLPDPTTVSIAFIDVNYILHRTLDFG